jgi:hypothetical protein
MMPSFKQVTPMWKKNLGVDFVLASAASAQAQSASSPVEDLHQRLQRKDVDATLAWIDASESRATETLISLASIVSPSGRENQRAGWVAERMRAIGLEDVSVDATPNVVGRIKGRSDGSLIFVTTLDDLATVAEVQRTSGQRPRREGNRVIGPATEVQSVNAAVVLAAEALVRARVEQVSGR